MTNQKEDKVTKKEAEAIVAERKLLEKLKGYYDTCVQYYAKEHKKMKLLDATDRGDMWKAIGAKFPKYQILPDTNHVSYVKNNILASIYTVTKGASISPTSEEDKQLAMDLNIALENIWHRARVGFTQFQTGERAALLNLGLTQVGWDEDLSGGTGNTFYKGNITVKAIDPMKFMRDPFSDNLDVAGYCMTYDNYHESVFKKNKLYKEKFEEYVKTRKLDTEGDAMNTPVNTSKITNIGVNQKGYYTLIVFWVREGKQIHEYHTVNCEKILHEKKNIKPSIFPFADLYCNLPAGALVGTSEPAKIFASSVAYNMMDSLAFTAEYKNQRPPKYVSTNAGLNISEFAKHADDADKTFIVNGDASKVVHYHEYPSVSPQLANLLAKSMDNMQTVTGVDGRYTGRDTGSIITTGGTEEMLNRVTVIDTPKIMNYEEYAVKLTRLILYNLIEFCPKRKYFVKEPNKANAWKSVEIDFPKIKNDTIFDYEINISSELPKTKQRIAQMANMLIEKQMQYREQGANVDLITEEEWLMFQDLPNKEYMLERMGLQRQTNALEQTSQVLFNYAELIKQGINPEEAIMQTAEGLKNTQMGVPPVPQGGVPGAGPEEALLGMENMPL
jgi:hypothetical protein